MRIRRTTIRQRRHAMTLTELMVASGIFLLAMLAILTIHLNGLYLSQFALSKIGASDEARDSISRMILEVRSAGTVMVGNGDETSFKEIPYGESQTGNALQIQPVKGDTNRWIRYFWDQDDERLKRAENDSAAGRVVANAITNRLLFTAEDFRGQVLTNNRNNRVIGVTLQFFQLQYPSIPIGPGSVYDFYQLRTKITRRAIE